MNRRRGIVALGLACVAVGAFWLTPGASGPAETPPVAVGAGASPVPSAPPAAPAASAPPSAAAADALRTEAAPPTRSPSPATNCPQGLRGLVIDEDQRPLSGLAVYLVDSAANEPLAMPVLRQQRDAFGPVASAESGVDGAFAVGLPVAQDKIYELCVVSPHHAVARVGGLRLLAGEWHDLGAITMTQGATLRGRVTVAGRDDIPVPLATVSVEVGAAFADAALRALPGAGQGLVATADITGNYELRHVPSRGIVQAIAVAPGFARLRKPNIELRLDGPVEVNFALLPGQSLAGAIGNAAGAAVASARIEAWPQHAAGDPLITHSDENGHFEVLGLLPGKHRVRVIARGYEPLDERDVEPGRSDLRFVLQAQSRVRVRVVTPGGETLRSYQLGLRRAFPEQGDQIAAVAEVPEQRVRLDGLTDWAEVSGVPIGVFRCQVEAEGFAKTLSDVIDNGRRPGEAAGPRQFDVVVTMSQGATLRGRVVDESGAPLAGATVLTQADGTLPDSPFYRMIAGAIPDKITALRTTTRADGSFLLPTLALADYQLLVEHEDACRTVVPGLRLDRAGERVLPPIAMAGGALVSGRATVAGRTVGQVKVVLTTPPTLTAAKDAIRLETITDAAGVYRMPRRVPPGTYELRAAVVGTTEPEAQIFRQLLQLQRSSIPLVVSPGQRQVEHDIDLPSDH